MVQRALPQLILLFVTDQFRHDAFQPLITPNLYQLSLEANATTFTNAYSSTPTCTPARASLLTGKSPWAHGMLGYANTVNCQGYPTTLPAMLNELRDYETFSVGKNHFGWDATTGDYVDHGFQHMKLYEALSPQPHVDDYHRYYDKLHPGEDPLAPTCHHLGYNDWRACPYGRSQHEEEHPTAWTTRMALDYLQNFDFSGSNSDNDSESQAQPKMFLKVSYHRPHSPYDPPQRLLDKYLNSSLVPNRHFSNKTSGWDDRFINITSMPAAAWHGDPGEQAAHHSRAGYLANVDFVDEGIGEILDWLRHHHPGGADSSLLDASMILWASDHGDMNGDHNLWRKGYAYEGSSHVNFMAKLPKYAYTANHQSSKNMQTEERHLGQQQPSNAKNGLPKTSQALVDLRDVAVTIYDYLGIMEQVKYRDPRINGLSLVPILQDTTSRDRSDRMVRSWLDLEHAVVYDAFIHWNAIVGFHEKSSKLLEEDIRNGSDEDRSIAASSSSILWKYIFYAADGTEQLFSLSTDPSETIDLSRSKLWSHILQYWRETMVEQFEREKRGEDWVKDGTLIVRQKSTTFGANFPCLGNISQKEKAGTFTIT